MKYKIAIAGDHAGFEYKNKINNYFTEKGCFIKDFGCYSEESIDYPDTTHLLADAVEKGDFDLGLVFCGSGNGVTMTANKHQGVRAALCWNTEIAKLARLHNNANVCGIPARFISYEDALNIVKIFISTNFEGGRHERRVKKIPL